MSTKTALDLLSEGDDAERLAALVTPDMINVFHGKQTLLMVATRKNRVACVRWLCERGANVNAVDKYASVLHYASYEGKLECMSVLLQHGAITDATTRHGHTPLYISLCSNHMSCARLLLYNGASLSKLFPGTIVPLYVRTVVRGQEQCRAACRALLALRVAGRDVTPVIARMLWTTRGMEVWQDASATGKRRVGE